MEGHMYRRLKKITKPLKIKVQKCTEANFDPSFFTTRWSRYKLPCCFSTSKYQILLSLKPMLYLALEKTSLAASLLPNGRKLKFWSSALNF